MVDLRHVVDRRDAVVDQDAVGNRASYRSPSLVVVGVDEAGHDDLAAGVDLSCAPGLEIRPDGNDLLALDQHVGAYELTLVGHGGVHRHDHAAADHIAPAPLAAVLRWPALIVIVARARWRVKEAQSRAGCRGGGSCLQEIAPSELGARVVLRKSLIAQGAHSWSPPLGRTAGEVGRCADSSLDSGLETALL